MSSSGTVSVLEELRVFKRVDQKIRSTLVSGREEMVSPTVVTRSFLDSYEKMVPATSLVRIVPHTVGRETHCIYVHSYQMYVCTPVQATHFLSAHVQRIKCITPL